MLEVQELEKLMSEVESDRVERKESISDPEKIRQAICAYANDLPDHRAPGYIFIGANNAGNPVSLPITDQLLLTLSNMRSDGNILPLPYMTVEKVTLKGVPVAVVEVHPSDMPPVRLRGQVWIRVGPRRATATLQEERVLTERQVAGSRTFDHRPCPDATLDDLLVESFRSEYLPRVVDEGVIAQNDRSAEEQLASLRFFDLRRRTPTYAGVLVFGKDPLNFMPGAFIQFVRFDGVTLADSVQDEKPITGNLLTQLLQIDNLLPLQIRTARASARGLRHEEGSDYPMAAVRELTLNAIMHRVYEATNSPVRINWFADRIEIQNPGGLYGQVTPENYERVSDYRNPVLAEVMKALGYVERFGTGITRANTALKANGNPPAEFTFEATHVLVTIRRRA
jgi:ATP-dependent DNA helicase RecG